VGVKQRARFIDINGHTTERCECYNPRKMSELDKKIKASRRLLEKINKDWDAAIAKLKKEKAGNDDIQMAHSDWSNEYDMEESNLDALLTQKLKGRAHELDVPLPHYPIHGKDEEDNEYWYRSPMDGRYTLTQRGRDYMDDAIWKKEERQHNRRIRWITLGIGLTGALTGLVSVTANNWEKLGKILQHLHWHN
jgi:hypothetical protein